jgi:large subunit ribosomal protein L35
MGCRGGSECSRPQNTQEICRLIHSPVKVGPLPPVAGPDFKGSKMPKMKTKSSVKKRFSKTASGKIRANQANKQHGMIKRTNKQIRNQRGTTILSPQDARIIRKFMPND